MNSYCMVIRAIRLRLLVIISQVCWQLFFDPHSRCYSFPVGSFYSKIYLSFNYICHLLLGDLFYIDGFAKHDFGHARLRICWSG